MNANRMVNLMAIAAIVFGVLTVLTGGRALFGSLESRADFGNAVSFLSIRAMKRTPDLGP